MASQYSFDIVSRIDMQEVDNAVNQAMKEIRTRFDFKGTKCNIELFKNEKLIKIIADDDMKLNNVQDILKTRIAARNLSTKALEFKDPEPSFEGTLRQEVSLIQGLPQDQAKEIVRVIKAQNLKVQAAIQGDEVRVTSKSKDELQSAIQAVRSASLKIAVQFVNFR